MTSLPDIRQRIDTFDLDGREIAVLQRYGDDYDLVRLSYSDELDAELGRVVGLNGSRPQLATGLAVWKPDTRDEVLRTVRRCWQFYEREVIA